MHRRSGSQRPSAAAPGRRGRRPRAGGDGRIAAEQSVPGWENGQNMEKNHEKSLGFANFGENHGSAFYISFAI